MGDFDFEEWSEKLPPEVVDVLKREGFTGLLALLYTNEKDITALKLRRGHHVQLRQALSELQQQQGGGPLVVDNAANRKDTPAVPTGTSDHRPAGELLQELLGRQPTSASGGVASLTDSMGRLDLDPQIYLKQGERGTKPLLIPDFVPHVISDCKPEEIELGGWATLRLPSQSTPRPKLDSISPYLWIVANARIMATLQAKGALDGTGLLDYMSYTAKFGELACRYTWSSVLHYANEYRTLQAAVGFTWGSDSPHLSRVALKERQQQSGGGPGVPKVTLHYYFHIMVIKCLHADYYYDEKHVRESDEHMQAPTMATALCGDQVCVHKHSL